MSTTGNKTLLGVEREKMKKTRVSSKKRIRKARSSNLIAKPPSDVHDLTDEYCPRTIKVDSIEGDFHLRITNFRGEERILPGRGGWQSGDIIINRDGIYWKGVKIDVNFGGVIEIDWEVLKEITEASAQELGLAKYKPFEEIRGQDIKASSDGEQCVICLDNKSQCANTGCGHKIFCINCANNYAKEKENACPVCSCKVEKLIRIF